MIVKMLGIERERYIFTMILFIIMICYYRTGNHFGMHSLKFNSNLMVI